MGIIQKIGRNVVHNLVGPDAEDSCQKKTTYVFTWEDLKKELNFKSELDSVEYNKDTKKLSITTKSKKD